MGKIDIKGDIASNDLVAFYDFFGMTCTYPKMVQDAIENDEDEEITLNIASNGGDVFAASEIYTMLKASGKRIVVNVQGLAASAASVISMAGNVVRMSPTSQMMIHKASVDPGHSNADDLEHQSTVLNSIDESIALAYEMKTGLKQPELLDLMAKETWLNAKTAVDKGFADEIMFFENDEEEIMVTNATHQLPSKSAIAKFKNMIATPKTNTLREQKLAILLEK
nr:MAG TPA: Putative ATP dependent Clp protease [Caudoviricetes sp.]